MALFNRRQATLALAGALAACSRREASSDPDAPQPGSLAWAVSGRWRLDPDRDDWRHPLQTLLFWGLAGDMNVLEVLPGIGWYTAILAPFLAANGGHLIVASFDPSTASMARREVLAAWEARFAHDPRLYGHIERTVLSDTSASVLAPAGGVDLAILANNLHTLMAQGIAERVLGEIFAALRPGGVLGVEQHRAASAGVQDPLASTGYVQEAYVKLLAQEAGFDFVAASDLNANPHDDRNHPFGVWTLPPTLRTAPLGRPENPRFDTSPYRAIGESDRMTLRFRKPSGPAARAPTRGVGPPP